MGKKIIVHAAGGLGNQLFVYFAGFHFARKLNSKLVVDLLWASREHSKHHDLRSFQLEAHFVNSSASRFYQLKKGIWRIFDSLSFRVPGFGKLMRRVMKIYTQEPNSEYDSSFILNLNRKKVKRIIGYFSSSKYLELLQAEHLFTSIELRNPSDWYQKLEKKARSERPIVVHVRRGDLMNSINVHGVLSEEYYEYALTIALERYPENPIWIFTDTPEDVKTWNLFLEKQAYFVEPVSGGGFSENIDDPAEHLKLMTYGIVNIVANSSFSLFGALLNPDAKIVICPESIARTSEMDLESFFPKKWIHIPAIWEKST
jgi:hypothetical protein